MDTDHSGMINLEEFVGFVHRTLPENHVANSRDAMEMVIDALQTVGSRLGAHVPAISCHGL